MKPTAYLVNTSRGPIVDEAALVDVLDKGGIAGAGLDVFDREPLPLDHPLRRLENTVITPHVGYVDVGAPRTKRLSWTCWIRAVSRGPVSTCSTGSPSLWTILFDAWRTRSSPHTSGT